MVPIHLIVHATRNPVVAYFHGETYYVLITIPVLILVLYGYRRASLEQVVGDHVTNGHNVYVTHFALILPSVLLLVYGTSMLTSATSKADRFYSNDCNAMSEKAELQRSWEEARSLYRRCLRETAEARNLTETYLAEKFRIQDCLDYEPTLRDHPRTWPYLQHLEENHACTGFCKPGEQLWSNGPHKDACAMSVASVFRHIVQTCCTQVVAFSLITLCLDMSVVVFLGPALRSLAVDF